MEFLILGPLEVRTDTATTCVSVRAVSGLALDGASKTSFRSFGSVWHDPAP
jgi:hypothetical protein